MSEIQKNNTELPQFSVVRIVYLANNERKSFHRLLISSICFILLILALAAILTLLLFPIEKIDGDNLSGELDNNDIVLCIKQPSYNRGDLVVLNFGDFTLVKRIVGVSGDNISFDENDNLLINNVKVDEPYLLSDKSCDYENIYPVQVEVDRYFVLSDNREVISDSRSGIIGQVKRDNIVGRVLCRF